MFLSRLRPLISGRGIAAAGQLHTTRPVAADFASDGKTATAGAQLAVDAGADSTKTPAYTYTKQLDVTPEPRVSHTGTRTYVVAPKDSASYDVPGGAYGSSDPYLTPPKTPAPQTSASASTSPSPAHPNTTSHVPRHPDGVGESAAASSGTPPGGMHTRGGSNLIDALKTAPIPAQRNMPPIDEGGRVGNSEMWKKHKK